MSWYGPRRHVLLYPLRHDRHPDSVYSLSAFVPATEVHRESWTASGDLADLHASLADACPAMHDLLALMDEALITGIYFRDPLETWGSDRVILLGDAAHPAPPSAGQGAGMALEDAVMLAACLQRAGTGNEQAALREYVFRRQARTTRMLESSRVNLRNSQTSDPVQVRARNGYVRGLAAAQPGRPAHAGMAARARPGRRRAAVTRGVRAEPGRSRQSDAPAGVAAGLRPVARGADGRAPGGGLARRAPGLRRVRAGQAAPGRRERGPPPASTATGHLPCGSGDRRGSRRVRLAGAGGAAPARRRLRDGLGGAVGAARRTAGGGGRRLVTRPRLPARARAPVPGGAGRRPGRLPLAGPRVPAGPDPGQRRVRGRRPRPQPCPGAARRRRAGHPDARGDPRRLALLRPGTLGGAPGLPPAPTRGSTASR